MWKKIKLGFLKIIKSYLQRIFYKIYYSLLSYIKTHFLTWDLILLSIITFIYLKLLIYMSNGLTWIISLDFNFYIDDILYDLFGSLIFLLCRRIKELYLNGLNQKRQHYLRSIGHYGLMLIYGCLFDGYLHATIMMECAT